MATLKYNVYASSTLGTGYTAADPTLTVADGSKFPSAGDFWVRLANANQTILKITSRAANILTRAAGAADGTTDQDAGSGLAVDWVMGTAALDQLRADLCRSGAATSLPSTADAKEGDRYQCSDSPYNWRFNGTIWEPWAPSWKLKEPISADFSWVNQQAAAIDTSLGGVRLYEAASETVELHIRKKAAPSTPYIITAGLLLGIMQLNANPMLGLVFRNSSSGKIHFWGFRSADGTLHAVSVYWADPTTVSAWWWNQTPLPSAMPKSPFGWLRIADDGVNRICSFSATGYDWFALHTVARTEEFTADEVGFAINGQSGTYACYMHLLHWEET